jgi:hypothetical protein
LESYLSITKKSLSQKKLWLKEVSDRTPYTLPKNKGILVIDDFKRDLTDIA